MSLHTVSTGGTVNAVDINQFTNVLQEPSGGTEAGKYWLLSQSYTSGVTVSMYLPTLSRGATPVSISIDTADQGPTAHLNSPSAQGLTASGFRIQSTTTAASLAEFCGGNWTVSY